MAVATGGTGQVQGELWSARADDWAEVHEHNMRPVYEAVLDLVHAGPGVSILEVGWARYGAPAGRRPRRRRHGARRGAGHGGARPAARAGIRRPRR